MVCLRHVRRLSVATLGVPVCSIHVQRDQGRLYPYVYRRDKCLYMRASIWVLKAQQWFKLQVKACLCLKASYFTARNLFHWKKLEYKCLVFHKLPVTIPTCVEKSLYPQRSTDLSYTVHFHSKFYETFLNVQGENIYFKYTL